MRRNALTLCAVLLAATANLQAQSVSSKPCTNDEDNGGIAHWLGGSEQACEVRSATLPLDNGRLNIQNLNGSIELIGEDRSDVYLEARVTARAHSQTDAASLLHQVTIQTGGTIEAKGPHTSGSTNWSVSYKLRVPRHLAADLRTMNGSLSLSALDGNIKAETTNGSLKLDQLAGDVHVSTTNGSIKANLAGSTWQGSGLSATTTNGAVSVSVPNPYSAHLVAGTTNGGTSINVPGIDQTGGRHREINTTLGSGGPTLTFETTNGGVSIN
jgi:DUF4097 and DUF4098 domain-containing protein YvlB